MRALDLLQADHDTIWNIPEHYVNRMLVCGKCPKSDIDYQASKTVFRYSLDTLITKIDNFNPWGPDPELQQIARTEINKRGYETRKLKEVANGE